VKLAATTAPTVTLPGASALIDLFDADKPSDDDVPPDPTLQGFRKQFAEIMESDELKPLERVVVLVDDLARSLPDTVVETLEAIKLFLSVKKMAFVIAADEENVASAIGCRLATTGQPITSRLYLGKIVQVPGANPSAQQRSDRGVPRPPDAGRPGEHRRGRRQGEGVSSRETRPASAAPRRYFARWSARRGRAGRGTDAVLHRYTVGNPAGSSAS
jgi:hypothetical protein